MRLSVQCRYYFQKSNILVICYHAWKERFSTQCAVSTSTRKHFNPPSSRRKAEEFKNLYMDRASASKIWKLQKPFAVWRQRQPFCQWLEFLLAIEASGQSIGWMLWAGARQRRGEKGPGIGGGERGDVEAGTERIWTKSFWSEIRFQVSMPLIDFEIHFDMDWRTRYPFCKDCWLWERDI